MSRQAFRLRYLAFLIAVALGTLLGLWAGSVLSNPRVPDSMMLYGTVISADHEVPEGYFEISTGADQCPCPTLIVPRAHAELFDWFAAHRDQPIVVTFRERRGVKD